MTKKKTPPAGEKQKLPPVPNFGKAYKHLHVNNIPPRFQWNSNNGYCGEVSMISAGLYYGQYISQFDVRKIVSGKNQQQQLLLGYNDGYAAASLRLKYEKTQLTDSEAFMVWAKHHVVAGHPVIIGVMNNVNTLGEGGTGDPEFDHIVPVMGFASKNPLNAGFDPSDKILFSDNGLYTGSNAPMCVPGAEVPYYFVNELGSFFCNRKQANQPDHLYSVLGLPEYLKLLSKKDEHFTQNYGIAITGIMGEEETVPVRVSTSLNYEAPCIGKNSNKRPAPMKIDLTVTVSGLKPGKKYKLFCYPDESLVPVKDFIKNSKKKFLFREITVGTGSVYSTTIKSFSTDKKAFFRAVMAD